MHSKRDHGGLLFVDLRDHYGLTQFVFAAGSPAFEAVDADTGGERDHGDRAVVPREPGTVNPSCRPARSNCGPPRWRCSRPRTCCRCRSRARRNIPDDIRLKYRFIDLRREKVHRNIVLRAKVIASIRGRMIEAGFTEFQTPILTASSPEGARDFLVPARLHPGKFYALPQAPQQFKQLIMVAGFDRYFQIAPCFRDEASRADRSPGEFYQLDFEMSYVTQEDVFNTIEPVIAGVFEEFAEGRGVTKPPFPRIPYDEAMLIYGQRQARSAQPAADHRRDPAVRRVRVRAVRAHRRFRRVGAGDSGAGRGGQAAQLLRQAERVGARAGRRRAWATSSMRRTGRRGRSRATWNRNGRRRSGWRAG